MFLPLMLKVLCAIMHITNAKEVEIKTIGYIPLAFGDGLILHCSNYVGLCSSLWEKLHYVYVTDDMIMIMMDVVILSGATVVTLIKKIIHLHESSQLELNSLLHP